MIKSKYSYVSLLVVIIAVVLIGVNLTACSCNESSPLDALTEYNGGDQVTTVDDTTTLVSQDDSSESSSDNTTIEDTSGETSSENKDTTTVKPTNAPTKDTTAKQTTTQKVTQATTSKPDISYTISLKQASTGNVQTSLNGFVIDTSNVSQGYIMVKGPNDGTKNKILIYYGSGSSDYVQYILENTGGFEAFPLTNGSIGYKVRVMQNVMGTKYTEKNSAQFTANLASATIPYLYNNQGVAFNKSSSLVTLAYELSAAESGDKSKVTAIYNYIIKNIKYDTTKASSILSGSLSGYIPSAASTLSTKKGICSDYSSLMAAMCRSIGIPCRIIYGKLDGYAHAWNEVYYDGNWYRYDATYGAGGATGSSYTGAIKY